MIDPENMDVGYQFAGAFLTACIAVVQAHPNLRLYQIHGLNLNTVFILSNGNMEMVIDTKLRRNAAHYNQFGINAGEWLEWQHPNRVQLPVVEVVVLADGEIGNRNQHMRPMCPIAILAYATYRPENDRLFAQSLGQIRVVAEGPEFVDTELSSYANLSAILQEGVGVELQLAQQIEQQTLANALANPLLNPHAR